MTKAEFLNKLCTELSGLSPSDINSSIEYYSEMISDRTDAGMSEEEAVAELGSPKAIAREIIVNMPIGKVIKSTINKRKRVLKMWEIICLILGSPIWLSMLAAAVCILLSLYVAVWSVFISVLAVDIAAFAGGAGITFASLFNIATAPATSTVLIGLGLCAMGIGAFCFLPCIKIGKVFVKTSIALTKAIKAIIVGKEK